jgi:hypothetical protein
MNHHLLHQHRRKHQQKHRAIIHQQKPPSATSTHINPKSVSSSSSGAGHWCGCCLECRDVCCNWIHFISLSVMHEFRRKKEQTQTTAYEHACAHSYILNPTIFFKYTSIWNKHVCRLTSNCIKAIIVYYVLVQREHRNHMDKLKRE